MEEALSRTWREVADQHHAALLDDLAAAFDARLGESVSQAVAVERQLGQERTEAVRTQVREETLDRTRRTVTDGLNQTLRRIRQSPSRGGVLKLLAEASAPWAAAAAVVLIEDGLAKPIASRNLRTGDELGDISLEDNAAALNSVIETADPITSIASASEISAELSDAFGHDMKCQLLPITVRGSVTAVLVASGDEMLTGALELLTEAAGMRLEALEPTAAPVMKPLALKPPDKPGLVQIAGAAAATASPAGSSWNALPADEQKAHLAAQRVARVKVAEMRLYQADALRQGVFSGGIYLALKPQIDEARKEFLQNCLTKSSSMVDYLHLELLRSLAHDDERLLGSDYPGPMV